MDFRYLNHLDSFGRAGEVMPQGTRVKADGYYSDGFTKWMKADADTAGAAVMYHDVRLLSAPGVEDIWQSTYDEGLDNPAVYYNARRNVYRPFLANVGDVVSVVTEGGVLIEGYDLYTGTVATGAYVTCGASGMAKTAADKSNAWAYCRKGGTASNGDKITLQLLG